MKDDGLCQSCGKPMFIKRSFRTVTGDNSPGETTRLFHRFIYECVDPRCPAYKREEESEPVEEPLS